MTEDIKREIDILCNFLKNCKDTKRNFIVSFNTTDVGTSRNYFYGETIYIVYPSKEFKTLILFQSGYNGCSISIDLSNIKEMGHKISKKNKTTFFIQFKNNWILIMEE